MMIKKLTMRLISGAVLYAIGMGLTLFGKVSLPAELGILIIAYIILGCGWSEWLRKGFVFLIVSCHCALVISIPLTFFGGIGAASKRGVLVKESNYLEALNKESVVVFDKTGTLTEGVFKVVDKTAEPGFTKVYIAVDGSYVGCIVIDDEVKDDSRDAIASMKKTGIEKTVMPTGDDEKIGKSVAEQLGLDEYYAQLLSDQKVEKLEYLDQHKKGNKLAFVGDGVNDAPVLARADVELRWAD